VGEGFVQVAKNKVLVLTETCERAEEIDLASAKAGAEAAATKLASLKRDTDEYNVQRAKVERAAARVLVASRR
jgi:F-type H+-transporting ATPase subunit epsilon